MDKNQATCVDPELEVLVPPKNSTTVQHVGNTSFSGLFTQVCAGAIKLVELLPSMSNAVKEVKEAEKCVQSILVCITADSDPEVRDKFATLQKEFRDFIRVGKEFLEDCLSMAKYATDEQHLTEIKEQLESKILFELKMYIDSISGYVKDCEESFEKFQAAHKEMDDQIYTVKEYFSGQLKEAGKKASDSVEKYERAVIEREHIKGLKTVLSMASSASAVAGASGIIPPEVAVFQSLSSYVQAYLACTNEGITVLDVMKQERAREETATKEKILQYALNCVVDLQEAVLNATSLNKDMTFYVNCASKVIEKRGELKESNKEDIDFHDLKNKLDMLQRAAGEIASK